MRLFLKSFLFHSVVKGQQDLTNLVIVCLSSTSKGGRGAFMWKRRRMRRRRWIIWKAAVQNADVTEDGEMLSEG